MNLQRYLIYDPVLVLSLLMSLNLRLLASCEQHSNELTLFITRAIDINYITAVWAGYCLIMLYSKEDRNLSLIVHC